MDDEEEVRGDDLDLNPEGETEMPPEGMIDDSPDDPEDRYH